LVELMVAMALLSLVMGMGFVATSAMQRAIWLRLTLPAISLRPPDHYGRSSPSFIMTVILFLTLLWFFH